MRQGADMTTQRTAMSTNGIEPRNIPRKLRLRKPIYAAILLFLVAAVVLLSGVGAFGANAYATVGVEGTPAAQSIPGIAGTATAYTTGSFSTGTGANRLTLVGISFSTGSSTTRSISSVTFNYGATSVTLDLVKAQPTGANTGVAAIYKFPASPAVPSGQAGTLTITLSGTLAATGGIVVNFANFTGVDQTTPLDVAAATGANGSSTTPSAGVTTGDSNELVFDTVVAWSTTGTQAVPPTLSVGSGQTQLWNLDAPLTAGCASTRQSTSGSATMSWARGATGLWAIAAVPINPAGLGESPVAVDDSARTVRNQTVKIAACANDTDPEGNGLSVTDVSGASHGTPSYNGNTISYAPAADYLGADSFTYTVSDGSGTDTGTVNVMVTAAVTIVEWSTGVYSDTGTGINTGTSPNVVTSVTLDYTAAANTGSNRLMLVGVSWNCGTTSSENETITSATYTGGTLTQLYDYDVLTANGHRHSAIYYVINPTSGAGQVILSFTAGDGVDSGVVAGVAFFTGVDQSAPLGAYGTATGGSQAGYTTATVTLSGLTGNELVFDNLFRGGSSSQTQGAGQTRLWDVGQTSARGAASYKQATSSSVTMSWVPTTGNWLPIAVPINPAPPVTNAAPVVTDIPDQTIAEGASFTTINLDDYVSDVDNADAEMTWSYSGNTDLTVSITDRVATISAPSADWNGAETITFRATDPGLLWDDDPATFTVTAVNDAPVVSDIPDQTVAEGSTFVTISLDDYVSDVDNTDAEMTWTFSEFELFISINPTTHVATITAPSADWNGAETITFTGDGPGRPPR